MTSPPETAEHLAARAHALSGRTLGELAGEVGRAVPEDLRRAKGWVGQLLEACLGAHGLGDDIDFPTAGVELKTVPVDRRGRPRESTWVTGVPTPIPRSWERSRVRAKLARVLWVPIETEAPIGDRRVGSPRLWSPSEAQEEVLRDDWETLTEALVLGARWQLDASRGEALQIRPKAASSKDWSWGLDEDGEWVRDVAQGFYLRRTFVAGVLAS